MASATAAAAATAGTVSVKERRTCNLAIKRTDPVVRERNLLLRGSGRTGYLAVVPVVLSTITPPAFDPPGQHEKPTGIAWPRLTISLSVSRQRDTRTLGWSETDFARIEFAAASAAAGSLRCSAMRVLPISVWYRLIRSWVYWSKLMTGMVTDSMSSRSPSLSFRRARTSVAISSRVFSEPVTVPSGL